MPTSRAVPKIIAPNVFAIQRNQTKLDAIDSLINVDPQYSSPCRLDLRAILLRTSKRNAFVMSQLADEEEVISPLYGIHDTTSAADESICGANHTMPEDNFNQMDHSRMDSRDNALQYHQLNDPENTTEQEHESTVFNRDRAASNHSLNTKSSLPTIQNMIPTNLVATLVVRKYFF